MYIQRVCVVQKLVYSHENMCAQKCNVLIIQMSRQLLVGGGGFQQQWSCSEREKKKILENCFDKSSLVGRCSSTSDGLFWVQYFIHFYSSNSLHIQKLSYQIRNHQNNFSPNFYFDLILLILLRIPYWTVCQN